MVWGHLLILSEVNDVSVTVVSLILNAELCLVSESTNDLLIIETELPVSTKKLA